MRIELGPTASVRWYERDRLDLEARKRIVPADVALDVGCGIRPQSLMAPKLLICCDPHREYIELLRHRFAGRHDVLLVNLPGESLVQALPDQSVDSVFLLDVLEHLPKGAGKELLAGCARIARKQVVAFTPLGYLEQDCAFGARDAWGLRGGAWQTHRSGWNPEDFDSSWEVLACRTYHLADSKGALLDPPFGAFWAIRTCTTDGDSPMRTAVLAESGAVGEQRLYDLLDESPYIMPFRVSSFRPGGPARILPKGVDRERSGNESRSVIEMLGMGLRLLNRGIRLAHVVRKTRSKALVVVEGNLGDMTCGYLASKVNFIPLFLYFPVGGARGFEQGWRQRLAGRLEAGIASSSRSILIPNDGAFGWGTLEPPIVVTTPTDFLRAILHAHRYRR